MNHRTTRRTSAQARVALVTALSLLTAPLGPIVGAQTAKPVAPVDGGWPRSYKTASGASLVIYQPQIASWANQQQAVIWAAVAYTPNGATQPALGTVKVEADTSVALEERLVSFSVFRIMESNFPTLQRDQLRTAITEISSDVPLNQRVIALDRVLANIDKSQIIPKNLEGVKADPPPIFFSEGPAVMVNIDGEPVWSPIMGNDLKYAVNTNWDLFQHGPTGTYYLRDDRVWLKAMNLDGSWGPAGDLPASFQKLPANGNFKEAKASLPGRKVKADQTPKVFVSVKPAELILLQGKPNYMLVQGTSDLLWVSNTDSDVFREGLTGPVYYLVSGRWFSAPDFTGPWTFATPTLPADFKRIPLDHPRSRVLASVPGTEQAMEGVILANVPQTASVSKNLKAPAVVYQGAPQFLPIETTTVERAVNTDKQILKVGDLYYMCFQGVWFMSRSATGPWEVTGSVPSAIYTIPPSSPDYNVTYVTVQQSSSDAVVFATVAAYTGLMIAWGCAVSGTGFYYPPYVYHGGFYPVYYPHYPTYGYGATYNPWTGAYRSTAGVYGPYGGAGASARYNPTTGTYSRGAVAYGPYGAAGAGQAYNPRTGAYGQTAQGANAYGSWGSTSVQRGDQWANTQRTTNYATGTTTRTTQSSAGSSARVTGPTGNTSAIARSNSGDMYAGHDGNVYKNDGGSWQKYDNGGWNSVQQPSGQLQNDYRARGEGAERTDSFSSIRSSGSWGSGSYRGGFGGGGFGGGFRRR